MVLQSHNFFLLPLFQHILQAEYQCTLKGLWLAWCLCFSFGNMQSTFYVGTSSTSSCPIVVQVLSLEMGPCSKFLDSNLSSWQQHVLFKRLSYITQDLYIQIKCHIHLKQEESKFISILEFCVISAIYLSYTIQEQKDFLI